MASGGGDEATELEKQHFRKILAAFRHYRRHSLQQVAEKLGHFNALPQRHKQLLGDSVPEHLRQTRVAIEHNAEIIKLIIADAQNIFDNDSPLAPSADATAGGVGCVTSNDMDKVRSTLKQFVRDWSSDGADERRLCYDPVLLEIRRLFPASSVGQLADVRVLVPGAGLGRLAWEIARLGYSCQGNEWSLYMVFSSYFVINKCREARSFTLYPWAHQFCNNWRWGHQLRPVAFPDVRPDELPQSGNFSMAAGDFLEVYTEPDAWHCVATVYFIDTARNIAAYVEALYRILRPGGYWINLGPLLYHFADIQGESSVELDYATLRQLVLRIGFRLIVERSDITSGYTQNPNSMLAYQYSCAYFVAQKPPIEEDEDVAEEEKGQQQQQAEAGSD